MSCSPVGPGTTATSSQPSSPLLSRICLVACTSSGTVWYSHLVMALTLAPGSPHPFDRHAFLRRQAFALGGLARQAFAFADAITGGELRRAVGSGGLHPGHFGYLRYLGHLGHGRRAKLRRPCMRDRRLGGGHLGVAQV